MAKNKKESAVSPYSVNWTCYTALYSRILVFCMQIIAPVIISVHTNDGFRFKASNNELEKGGIGCLNDLVRWLFSGYLNWDGQYFLHVAVNGYTSENTFAFFPLFPKVVRGIAVLINTITGDAVLSFVSTVIVVGWTLNLVLFIKTAKTLRQLTSYWDFGLTNLENSVALLFAFNPASIFFSAFYSESLFAYFTFSMFLALYKGKLCQAVLFCSLSTICRSNGILNCGFIVAQLIHVNMDNNDDKIKPDSWIVVFLKAVLSVGASLLPFAAYQLYCYQYMNLPAGTLPYQYIQSVYWDVGFLRYFSLKQLPNFLLAAPVLLALGNLSFQGVATAVKLVLVEKNYWVWNRLAVYAHGFFLTFFCLFYMHVQVSTRLIFSSCPYLYIFIAQKIRSDICKSRLRQIEYMPYYLRTLAWFLGYFLIGSVLFTTGYPWT